jgi:hypothetical protein
MRDKPKHPNALKLLNHPQLHELFAAALLHSDPGQVAKVRSAILDGRPRGGWLHFPGPRHSPPPAAVAA